MKQESEFIQMNHQNSTVVASHAAHDEDLLGKVKHLLSDSSGDQKITLLRDMMKTVLKLHDPDVDVLDIKILNRALKELRYGFKVFHPYQHIRKVSIYGSARTPQDDPNFQLASRFGRLLSERGFMVITGAGPGIMWAGHEGAGRAHSFGVNIMLPFEQAPNSLIAEDKKLVNLKYFFTRKLLFVKESHATVLFPGGFGTLDEGFEVLTLIQTGKTEPVPVVCLEAPGSDYWERWLEFIKEQLLPRGLISETDVMLLKVFHHEADAVEEIEQFYRNYHSIRYVGEKLVIRLQHALAPEEITRLNEEFQDVLVAGVFVQTAALPEEYDDTDVRDLPRLVFHYNRKDAGRLRQVIDRVNACRAVTSPAPFPS
ncbi:MAG: Rossman fold protein, TIGR00730 family [Nitrospirales bacterium]|nr:MAG: Rossman fold protein, TIGR00730 family [Nitrospirales bacterium]